MNNAWNEGWKFEPSPSTRSYIDYLDRSPVMFNEVRPLFDRNNGTTYITEANVKPVYAIYAADTPRDYRRELVDYIREMYKFSPIEERLENAVKKLLKEMENGKRT